MNARLLPVFVLVGLTLVACHHAAEVVAPTQTGPPVPPAARPPADSSSLGHAERLLAAGQLEGAVAVLQQEVSRAPDQLPARLLLGGAFLELGKAAQAEKALSPVVERWPQNPTAPLLLGYAVLEQGNLQGALQQFEHVLRLQAAPEQAVSAHLGLAALYEGQRDQPRATHHYEQALALAPELRTVLVNVQKALLWREATDPTGAAPGASNPRRARIAAELEKVLGEKTPR